MNNDIIMCQLDIVPIKNENGGVVFFLVSVKAGYQIKIRQFKCVGFIPLNALMQTESREKEFQLNGPMNQCDFFI